MLLLLYFMALRKVLPGHTHSTRRSIYKKTPVQGRHRGVGSAAGVGGISGTKTDTEHSHEGSFKYIEERKRIQGSKEKLFSSLEQIRKGVVRHAVLAAVAERAPFGSLPACRRSAC